MPRATAIQFIECGRPGPGFATAMTRLSGLTSWRRDGCRVGLYDSQTGPCLAELLADDNLHAVIDILAQNARTLPLPPAKLVMRLATSTALAQDVATPFAEAVLERMGTSGKLADRMAMALQEAIGNAVLHGNLELETASRGSLEGLTEFAAEMERRTADPFFSSRSVTISARWQGSDALIWVDDCGKGFQAPPPRGLSLSASGGNGIAMIRACAQSVTFRRGGRRVRMEFQIGI